MPLINTDKLMDTEQEINRIEIKLEELAERMAKMITAFHATKGDDSRKSQEILCIQAEMDVLNDELEEILACEHIEGIEEVEFDEEALDQIEEDYEKTYAMSAMPMSERV